MFTMHNADKELPTLQDFYLDTLQFYVDLTARGCLKVKKTTCVEQKISAEHWTEEFAKMLITL